MPIAITKIALGRDFWSTLNRYTNQKEQLKKKLRDFIATKMQDPTAAFGSSDKLFRGTGVFRGSNYAHAHLTFDISVVYEISGDTLNIYGVYTHDALGTGTPANVNRQQQNRNSWDRERGTDRPKISGTELLKQLEPEERGASSASSKSTSPSRSSYEPRKAQPGGQFTATQRLLGMAEKVDAAYPERNFYTRFTANTDKTARNELIRQEATRMIELRNAVKRRDPRAELYANQQEYMRLLQQLAALLNQ